MKKDIRTLAALLIASATFVACSSDDDIISENQQPVNPTGKYTMTINALKGSDATTRALSLDDKTLNVKWAATDEVSVFPESSWLTPLGTLTADASDNGSTTLTGDLTSAPSIGDQLNLLFPRATWDYTGQTGVLLSTANSIEKKYDYALANVEVASVDGNTITTTDDADFASQQAIVKFMLKNKEGDADLNASSLTVSAASNKLVTGKGFYTKNTTHSGYTYDDGTASSYESPSNLVDGKKNYPYPSQYTKWCTNTGDKVDGIWYCEFHTESAVQVNGYTITTGHDNLSYGNRNPKDWVLKAKADAGDSWTTIATVTNDATLEDDNVLPFDFNVDVPGMYQYFRFEVSATRGADVMQIEELELFKSNYGTAYGDLTVTPASATNEFFVALRNENASADTYTLSANVGGKNYAFSKSGVTFLNGKYYEITVKMDGQKVTNITLNKTSASLAIGGTVELSATVSPSDAVDKSVTWSSSNPDVATVDATTGVVTAIASGTATIIATAHDGGGTMTTCSVTVYPAGTIVWDSSNISSDLFVFGTSASYEKEGITLSANADNISAWWNDYGDESVDGIGFNADESGGFTFTAPTGKQFTMIEMTLTGSDGWETASLGTGWAFAWDGANPPTVTWTGTADNTVDLLTGASNFWGANVKSIVFFVSE